MAGPSRSNAAWERVLAAIEADAAKAAALLVSDDPTARAGIDHDGAAGETRSATTAATVASQGIPSTWRLPAAGPGAAPGAGARAAAGATPGAVYAMAGDLVLPDEMPPIPPELVDRIERLRAQIASLQADLESAMAQARASARPPRSQHRSGAEPRPELVDRRL